MNHPTSNRRCLSYRRVIRHSRKNLQIEAVCMGAYGARMADGGLVSWLWWAMLRCANAVVVCCEYKEESSEEVKK